MRVVHTLLLLAFWEEEEIKEEEDAWTVNVPELPLGIWIASRGCE